VRVFKADEPRLLLGVLDGGVLQRRAMRLLDARVPWGMQWRVVSAVGYAAMMELVCAAGAVVGVGPVLGQAVKKIAFDVISIKPTGDANEQAGLGATHDG
jgi:hypothetical protein